MKAQGGFEAIMVTSALMFILLSMTTYAYYSTQQVNSMQEEADFFSSCSKLQSLMVSSTFTDQETVTYFLHNMTIRGDLRTAYPEDPDMNFICPVLVPVNGSIVIPSDWYYPVNGTRFIGEDGRVNVTWGWYT